MVFSNFTANQVIQTMIDTNLFRLPITHDLIYNLTGIDFTTKLMIPIVPQLYSHYGNKPMNMVFTLLSGTQIDWSKSAQTTLAKVNGTIDWYVIDKGVESLAFQSLFEADAGLALQITPSKQVEVAFT